MRVIGLREALEDTRSRRLVTRSIRRGRVLFYPTDTVYGLGCDATDSRAVQRIRRAKATEQPLSVIAPSKDWMLSRLHVSGPRQLDRLPGPYTLVFRMRGRPVSPAVSRSTLGIRIPDHPFTEVIQESGVPFVTTSANMSGEVPAWSVQGMPRHIERVVDMAISGDILNNRPSRVIDLTGRRPRVIRE